MVGGCKSEIAQSLSRQATGEIMVVRTLAGLSRRAYLKRSGSS